MGEYSDLFLLGIGSIAIIMGVVEIKNKKKMTKLVNDHFLNNVEELSKLVAEERENNKELKKQLLETVVKIEKALEDNQQEREKI